MSFYRYYIVLAIFIFVKINSYAVVSFDEIKNRKIGQYELANIMLELSDTGQISLIERWKTLSPKTFQKVNFLDSYMIAAEESLKRKKINSALNFYIKAYQSIDKKKSNEKIEAAYLAAKLLYGKNQRSEALFYVNRALEESELSGSRKLFDDILSLKRSIVWTYFSRIDTLPDNAISAFGFDGDDVWIGMWSGSVVRYNRSSSKMHFFNPRNSKLPSIFVRDILVTPDKIWVATFSGLAYFTKKTASWQSVPIFSGDKLKKIIKTSSGFYVATLFKGVYHSVDGFKWKNIIPNKSVLDLLLIDKDLFLATPDEGVFLYRDGSLKSFLPKVSAKVMIQDGNPQNMWIGTYGQGLMKVNRHTGKTLKVFGEKEIGSKFVESLFLQGSNLWVGTLGKGAYFYSKIKNKWTYLGLKQGLPDLDVTTIVQEKDYLWFGTVAGGIGIYLFNEYKPIQGVSID